VKKAKKPKKITEVAQLRGRVHELTTLYDLAKNKSDRFYADIEAAKTALAVGFRIGASSRDVFRSNVKDDPTLMELVARALLDRCTHNPELTSKVLNDALSRLTGHFEPLRPKCQNCNTDYRP
jgi:hypothetical protein